MKMKMKRGSMSFVVVVVILLVVLYLVFQATSGYSMKSSGMRPAGVTTDMSDATYNNFFGTMTSLGPSLTCNPGAPDKVDARGNRTVQSSYYTGGLTPGGYCDDQEVVADAMNYKIIGNDAVLGD